MFKAVNLQIAKALGGVPFLLEIPARKAVALTPGGQNKERAELELAQRIAVEAAVEAIRKDLPDEVKFDRSVAQIGELPQEIRGRAPKSAEEWGPGLGGRR